MRLVLTYELISTDQGGYASKGITCLRLCYREPLKILDSLADDIRSGFGPGQDTWAAYLKDGVDTHYATSDLPAIVDLEYVHTENHIGEKTYSTVTLSEGHTTSSLHNFRHMTKLLNKLVKRCGKESDGEWYDPRGHYDFHLNDLPLVVATLEKMGAKRIQRYTPDYRFASQLVPYRCTLPTVFRGDKLSYTLKTVSEGAA